MNKFIENMTEEMNETIYADAKAAIKNVAGSAADKVNKVVNDIKGKLILKKEDETLIIKYKKELASILYNAITSFEKAVGETSGEKAADKIFKANTQNYITKLAELKKVVEKVVDTAAGAEEAEAVAGDREVNKQQTVKSYLPGGWAKQGQRLNGMVATENSEDDIIALKTFYNQAVNKFKLGFQPFDIRSASTKEQAGEHANTKYDPRRIAQEYKRVKFFMDNPDEMGKLTANMQDIVKHLDWFYKMFAPSEHLVTESTFVRLFELVDTNAETYNKAEVENLIWAYYTKKHGDLSVVLKYIPQGDMWIKNWGEKQTGDKKTHFDQLMAATNKQQSKEKVIKKQKEEQATKKSKEEKQPESKFDVIQVLYDTLLSTGDFKGKDKEAKEWAKFLNDKYKPQTEVDAAKLAINYEKHEKIGSKIKTVKSKDSDVSDSDVSDSDIANIAGDIVDTNESTNIFEENVTDKVSNYIKTWIRKNPKRPEVTDKDALSKKMKSPEIIDKMKKKIPELNNDKNVENRNDPIQISKSRVTTILTAYNDSKNKETFDKEVNLAFKTIGLTNINKYNGKKLIGWLTHAKFKSKVQNEEVDPVQISKNKVTAVVKAYNKSGKEDKFDIIMGRAFKALGLTNTTKYSGKKLIGWLTYAQFKTDVQNEQKDTLLDFFNELN